MLSTDALEIKQLAQFHETLKIPAQRTHPSGVNAQTLWSEIGFQTKQNAKKSPPPACVQAADLF
jgi:hypothetical protein